MGVITPENLVRHELIGLECEITRSSDPTLVGRKGVVVDETKNTLVLQTEKKEIRVPKQTGVFRFRLETRWVEIDGAVITQRPEDRIKKHRSN